jgi:ABC-type glycerol-3-phosphate transport system substrate-binding protein
MSYKQKMIAAVMILVAVCMLLGCTVTSTFTGTVTVTDSGSAVNDATVKLIDGTNELLPSVPVDGGVYTFNGLDAGKTYTVSVVKSDKTATPSASTITMAAPTVSVTLSSVQSSK